MTDYTKLTYQELKAGYAAKEFTPTDVIEAHLRRMAETRPLNAYITETGDRALRAAKNADQRYQEGTARPLEGLPLAVKDLFCTQDVRTTAASKILGDFTPFYSATVVTRLEDAGAISLGKTNLDEFAMGSSNETSAYGPVINPFRSIARPTVDLTPGGSSGGSSAAVAAYAATVALGTDTGGSIRQPASLCGLVGLKPTYGRCSRFGIVGFASSLDQAGPMARCVQDAADVFGAMSGYDAQDSTTATLPPFDATEDFKASIKGLKVGLPKEYHGAGIEPEVEQAWEKAADWLRAAGAEVVEVSLPHTHHSLPSYYIIAPAEASSNLARYDGIRFGKRAAGSTIEEIYENTRTEGFGEEVKRRIVVGTYVLSAGAYEEYYLRGLQVRRIVRNEFREMFKTVDVLLTPTTPGVAFGLGEKIANPMAMYLSDVYTVGANLAGIPAISVPAGVSSDGLPIGVQLIADDFQEGLLFKVADKIEQAAGYMAPTYFGDA